MTLDVLLVVNTVLGFLAAFTNGYYGWRATLFPRRLIQVGFAVLCGYAGVVYGIALLDQISPTELGSVYLRPLFTLLLLFLAVAPFFDPHYDHLEQEIKKMKTQQVQQAIEIDRLNTLIRSLAWQLSTGVDLSVSSDASKDVERPLLLVVGAEASGVNFRAEVDSIFRSGINYLFMESPVSRAEFLDELDKSRPAGVHVIGHMDTEGIHMGDGYAPIGWWRRVFVHYDIKFFFANGCDSLEVVDALHTDGVACVIGVRSTSGKLLDDVALAFARHFYQWFASGRSAVEAADLAKLALNYDDAEQIIVRGDWVYERK